jgi:hypothetical protein
VSGSGLTRRERSGRAPRPAMYNRVKGRPDSPGRRRVSPVAVLPTRISPSAAGWQAHPPAKPECSSLLPASTHHPAPTPCTTPGRIGDALSAASTGILAMPARLQARARSLGQLLGCKTRRCFGRLGSMRNISLDRPPRRGIANPEPSSSLELPLRRMSSRELDPLRSLRVQPRPRGSWIVATERGNVVSEHATATDAEISALECLREGDELLVFDRYHRCHRRSPGGRQRPPVSGP